MTAPVRRRLFAVWALMIWTGWLFSGELLDCTELLPVFARLLTPPWPAAGEAARAAALGIGGAVLTALAGLGAGRAILAFASPSRDLLLAFAAGLPLLALAVQGAGWLGLAFPGLLASMCAAGAVAALPAVAASARSRPAGAAAAGPGPLVWIPRVAAAAVLVAAFAPEMAWDAVVYHLRVPSLYLVSHRILPEYAIFPSFFPFTGEMLFLAARSMGGDPAARLMHAFAWLAAGAAVGRLASHTWRAAGKGDPIPRDPGGPGAWGRAMFLTLPFGMVIAGRAYVEFFLVLFLITSLLSVTAGRPRPLAAGWLAGAACGTKYLGGAAAVILFLLLLRRSSPRHRASVHGAAAFGAAALAAGGAWLLRNWLWTGNPVYPVIFGGPRWTPADMAGWRADASALSPDPVLLLTAPWRLMVEAGSDGALSPLVLVAAAGPLLWPAARGRLWGVAVSLVLVWWVTSPLTRYLMPALAVACAAGAGCVNGGTLGPAARAWLRRLSHVGLAGSVLCGIAGTQFSTASYDPAFGKETAAGYRTAHFRPEGYTAVLSALERRVPPRGRAYILGHVFSYDLPRRVWFDFLYVRPPLYWWVKDAATPRRVGIRARQENLTHLAWHPLGGLAILGGRPWLSDWTPGRLRAWTGFWRHDVRVAERIGEWVLFEIVPGHGKPWTGRTVPGTEAVTGPADEARRDGRKAEAARLAREALARFPGFPDAVHRAAEYGGSR